MELVPPAQSPAQVEQADIAEGAGVRASSAVEQSMARGTTAPSVTRASQHVFATCAAEFIAGQQLRA